MALGEGDDEPAPLSPVWERNPAMTSGSATRRWCFKSAMPRLNSAALIAPAGKKRRATTANDSRSPADFMQSMGSTSIFRSSVGTFHRRINGGSRPLVRREGVVRRWRPALRDLMQDTRSEIESRSAQAVLTMNGMSIRTFTHMGECRTCDGHGLGASLHPNPTHPRHVPFWTVMRPLTRPSELEQKIMSFDFSYYAIAPIILLVVICLFATIRILRQYERAVVFTLGKFERVKGPGLVLLFPFIQEMVRVDLRIQVIEIPSQDVISRDNVSMKVDAVLYFNVIDPERAIVNVQAYQPATNMLAQTTLRAVLGQHDLDEMLSDRKKLSTDVQSILDAQTETWGIKVSNVEIRTVELGENMVRAIAKQAEAERDRRAKVIHAEAEFQASQTLVNAARILGSVPAAMQLRYLQTLAEIGAEQNSTIVFPMPIDIIKPFLDLMRAQEDKAKPVS